MAKLFADKLKILETDLANISESYTKERITSIEQQINTVNSESNDKIKSLNEKLLASNLSTETKLKEYIENNDKQIKELQDKAEDSAMKYDERFDTLSSIVNRNKTDTDGQLAAIDEKINNIEQQLTSLCDRMKQNEVKITQLIDELTPIVDSHARALNILIGKKLNDTN